MTSRTVKFYGQGFGNVDATLTATLNGNTVYTGTVPTMDTDAVVYLEGLTGSTDAFVELFSVDVADSLSGLQPMTVTVSSGSVALAQILANYVQINNPVFSAEEWAQIDTPTATLTELLPIFSAHASPAFSAEELTVLQDTSTDPAVLAAQDTILKDHGVAPFVSSGAGGFGYLDDGESRENIMIDGVADIVPNPRPGNLDGTWTLLVGTDSVLTYDLMFNPAVTSV